MDAARIRNAFVLAAGYGTRLRPLSRVVPKPAWPLFDVPLAARVLDLIAAAGLRRAIVNLHHLPEVLRARLEPWIPEGLEVAWSHEPEIRGTGGALAPWRGELRPEPFVLANADTYQELDLPAMVRAHAAKGALATLSVAPAAGGPLEVDEQGRIVRFLDARAPGTGRGRPCEFTGVHVLEPEILAHIPDRRCCINADVHRHLVGRGAPVFAHVLGEGAFWSDLGTVERYLSAHRALLGRGRVPRAPGEVVETEGGRWYRGAGAR
ncbi:MAG: hypothetical protein D6708_07435, partial [Candidatus Dadabacteria bacterium]